MTKRLDNVLELSKLAEVCADNVLELSKLVGVWRRQLDGII